MGIFNPRAADSALARSASWLAGEAHTARAELVDGVSRWRKSPSRLDAAIAAYRRAAAAAPVGSDGYAASLGNLAVCLSRRFSAAGDPADLDDAIGCGRRAVNGTPVLSSNRPWLMANLAIHLNRRYTRSRESADLEASVFFAGASAKETSPWRRKDAAERWARFGQYAFQQHRETGNGSDLHAAVDASRRAVAATRTGDPARAVRLATLSASLHGRYTLTLDPADLDAAAAAAAETVARLPADRDDRTYCLSILGMVQLAEFERSGQLPDLERAVETGRQSLAGLPPDDPGRAGAAVDLALVLIRVFEMTGALAALDEAQAAIAEAVALTDEGSYRRHIAVAVQAAIRWRDYERTGLLPTLERAEAEAEQALAALAPGHFLRPLVLSAMGMIQLRRYERSMDSAALDRAITVLEEGAKAGGPGHYHRPGFLSMLGACLGNRYQRTGNAADLDDAIDLLREGAATNYARSHAQLWLANLCASLLNRFRRTEERADIDEAIEVARLAAGMTGLEGPNRALVLSSLGNSLSARFESRFRQAADLDEFVDAMRQAAEASQPGHASHPMHLMNLGGAHSTRFDFNGALSDAEEGVRYCRQAVAAVPESHRGRALYLGNLSACLVSLAAETRDRADAEEALATAREAVAATPPDHPDRSWCLRLEGNALKLRFELRGDPADLTAALGSWRTATSVTAADPASRLTIAQRWGRTAMEAGMIEEAVAGLSAAVQVLPDVVWHGLTSATRQQQAVRWAGLAADAACCAVLAGKPELAVELLEQGRSMQWSQALNLRADLGDLAQAAPELAWRLTAARAVLNAQVPSPEPGQPAVTVVGAGPSAAGPAGFRSPRPEDPRPRAARDYDETLRRIRQLDGFDHYLKPTPYPRLAAATSGGAAVIVNVSRYGCHAIMITADSERARVADLPGLDLSAAEGQARQISRLLGRAPVADRPFPDREADRRELLDILSWLWEAVGAPVLDALADILPAGEAPPRIWWCPTGPMVSLPLHAAGHHPRFGSGRDGDSVLARTVSSYIPTLTSLDRARRFAPTGPTRQLTVATRGQSRPGLPELPSVSAELACLTRHFPPGPDNLQLIGPAATCAAAVAGLTDHDLIHLACHAGPLASDDATVSSGFALWDGDLTITDLAAQPGRRGGLAFLSACQTAAGSDEHRDEALHLAAAMQFIGYSHVIATMWSIRDTSAPVAAETFYSALSEAGHDSADALRAAVLKLRGMDPTDPLTWAPYAHYGG